MNTIKTIHLHSEKDFPPLNSTFKYEGQNYRVVKNEIKYVTTLELLPITKVRLREMLQANSPFDLCSDEDFEYCRAVEQVLNKIKL